MWLGKTGAARARSPYPERADEKLGSLDFALTQVSARLSSRFERHASRLASCIPCVETYARSLAGVGDVDLARSALELRGPLLRNGFHADLVARSFALICEAASRRLQLRPYPVQLIGAWALLNGLFVEMETGEGKSLTGALAAATAALAGKPVHVITVNDYLAARDAEELGPVYKALGLTVGIIQHDQDAAARRAAYSCDVTYTVNKEVAFDYLRDRLALGGLRSYAQTRLRQLAGEHEAPLLLRGLWFAIVDEADSVLIDEARTPLIISGAESDAGEAGVYLTALGFARQMAAGGDFTLASTERSAQLTDEGRAKLKRLAHGLGGLWEARKAREELVNQALSALYLYHIDQHYAVVNGKVQIIDEFTGRIAEGRSWQHGLHQLIEAKENCDITERHQTRASITYQRFFRRYLHLCGMSGTLAEVAPELRAVYATGLARIPTNRPSRRSSRGVRVFHSAECKWAAVVDTIIRHHKQERPVLIGTRSIATSELLSRMLSARGIAHVVLNAHHDRDEAAIVAQAGAAGRITVATNMAGRGTDIKLGPGVAERGGLHVIMTEFHEAARIDRQLFGRSGRQGDPGTFEVIASLDDELMTFFPSALIGLCKSSSAQDRPLPAPVARVARWYAQARAQCLQYRMRRATLRLQDERDRALAFAKPE